MPGLTAINYDPGTEDRIMLQCKQSIVNLIETKRLHVCTHGKARCFKAVRKGSWCNRRLSEVGVHQQSLAFLIAKPSSLFLLRRTKSLLIL